MPADLVFGGGELREQSGPEYLRELHSSLLAVHKLARDQLKSTQEYQKRHYDLKQAEKSYQEGDLVYLLREAVTQGVSRKLNPVWRGPLLVVSVVTKQLYQVRDRRRELVVHHDRLKLFGDRVIPQWMRRLQGIFLAGGDVSTQGPVTRKPATASSHDVVLSSIRFLFEEATVVPEVPIVSTRQGRVPVRPKHLVDYVES